MKEKLIEYLVPALTACVLLGILIGVPAACTAHRHKMIAEVIKSGADPIAAKCAIEGDVERTALCISRATSSK